MKNHHFRNVLAIVFVVILVGINFLPILSAKNIILIKEEKRDEKIINPSDPDGIFDFIFFRVRGRIFFPFWSIIHGLKPQLDIAIIFWNFNNHSLFIDYHLEVIGTQGNIKLIDRNFTDREIFPHNGFAMSIGNFGPYDYTYGPFDVVLAVHNQNESRDLTVIYHGFVFKIGTIIFNPIWRLI